VSAPAPADVATALIRLLPAAATCRRAAAFLGTSRLHQSLDPAVLGTRFAPAYNAAIPNGAMQTNADDLERYVRLNSFPRRR
jgi:hypothetical protein